MEGTADLSLAGLFLALASIGEYLLAVDGHPGVEGWFEGVDAIKKGLSQGYRGKGPFPDSPGSVGDAELVGCRSHHGPSS